MLYSMFEDSRTPQIFGVPEFAVSPLVELPYSKTIIHVANHRSIE
jgi:hypothetical protein